MVGILSYGVYLPYWRLQRSAITAALGSGGGKGSRAVASYDEDTTSMGVEAARIALANAPAGAQPGIVAFATTAPAYLDKTNATAIHAALALPSSVGAVDTIGSVRSGSAAITVASAGGSAGASPRARRNRVTWGLKARRSTGSSRAARPSRKEAARPAAAGGTTLQPVQTMPLRRHSPMRSKASTKSAASSDAAMASIAGRRSRATEPMKASVRCRRSPPIRRPPWQTRPAA